MTAVHRHADDATAEWLARDDDARWPAVLPAYFDVVAAEGRGHRGSSTSTAAASSTSARASP